MCHPNSPAPEAEIFAKLSEGTEVVLFHGAGRPQVPTSDVTEVILAAVGFSAITNTGRRLSRVDATLIYITGDVLVDGEYKIAPEAHELLARAEAAQSDD